MMHHHHHSPAMRAIVFIAWLCCAIAAIAWGLVGLGGYLGKNLNLWDMGFLASNANLAMALQVVIGLAGVCSLICLFACCAGKDKK